MITVWLGSIVVFLYGDAEAAALNRISELLKEKLPPGDFKRFKPADIRNIVVNKRFEVSPGPFPMDCFVCQFLS